MKQKKHGWVLRASNTKKFIQENGSESKAISTALVFGTRKEARAKEDANLHRLDVDAVLKVELTGTGKAKKIIGRG